MRALFTLTPTESKRLIGKGVAAMPVVQRAKEKEGLLVGHGSTNVYVAEEILGKPCEREVYLSGLITRGILCVTAAVEKPPIIILYKGKLRPPALTMEETLQDFGRDSVFIKGANAVDPEGNAGVFMAHYAGGTIGWGLGLVLAKGINLIVPVGLEKLVPSVRDAARVCGQQTLDYCTGLRVGMMPLVSAHVVTEIEALRVLAGVEARHVASGGVNGSEGSVVLVAEGERESVERAIGIVESIKGERPFLPKKGICEACVPGSPAESLEEGRRAFEAQTGGVPHCMFAMKKEEELPDYLKGR